MGNEMNKTKAICHLALGTALYAVMGMAVKIPLIGHIQTDLGYVAFGVYLVLYGWKAAVVGVLGCIIESLIFSGWLPIGWATGQLFIGIVCGYWYKYSSDMKRQPKMATRIVITIMAVFMGIGIIKTVIECRLYTIPWSVKFAKNFIAFVADALPMLAGMFLGDRICKLHKEN